MDVFIVRFINFTIFPILAAYLATRLGQRVLDRQDRIEVFLMYMFGLGVAGSGIGGFFGHIFLSDVVAKSVGWPAGSPFQLEMGFANLALGVLGIIAVTRRDGFRLATIIAVTVVGVGATLVHIYDIILTGNLAPGNTIQNAANLLRPALLILIFSMWQRSQQSSSADPSDPSWSGWYAKNAQAVGLVTAIVATGFGIGFAFNQPVIGTLAGTLASLAAIWLILRDPGEAKLM